MFLDRRSLLQSAAALLVPPAAALSRSASAKHQKAVERYIQTFTAFYGKPYRPDDNSIDAHERVDEDITARSLAFKAAKDELKRLVMERHGLDSEKQHTGLAALSMDVADFTVVVGPEIDPDCESEPYGRDGVSLIPRTAAARARLDAIPTFDPRDFENDEEQERLGLRGHPRNEGLGFDPTRMPADEPVPVKVIRCDYGKGDDAYTQISRTWTPQGAYDCNRCKLCEFGGLMIQQLGENPTCQVEVWPDDAELVLYGATPPAKEEQYGNDLMVDTALDWEVGGLFPKPAELQIVAMSRTAWEADPRSKDDEWAIVEGLRATRGKLVVAARKVIGPVPWILEEPVQAEPAATA